MTKSELKKRAKASVRDQPAAKRTRANCSVGFAKAINDITDAKPDKFCVGDTWVNEHNQLMRLVAVTSSTLMLDSRFLGIKGRIFIIEVTEGKIQLQFCREKAFRPKDWGWSRIASPTNPKPLLTWRQLN